MRKSAINMLFLAATLATLVGCGDGNEAESDGATSISGRVEIVSGSTGTEVEKFRALAFLKGFFNPVKSANAQSAAGITIIAFQNGAEADRDTADSQGNFQIVVPAGGVVNLRIEADGLTANRLITVTPSSGVTLRLSVLSGVNPPEARIDAFDILSGSIRTRELEEFNFDEERANLTIDGGGGDCIRATGNSEVDIRVSDITLVNCDNGIVGENFANVLLEAAALSSLSIDARNNGIHAMDDSSIRLTGSDVSIMAGRNGILATSTSGVQIDSSGSCAVQGDNEAIDERDFAVINTGNCLLTTN